MIINVIIVVIIKISDIIIIDSVIVTMIKIIIAMSY